ncbi:putative mitochondrial hypothetical protein [Leptomonas pyrrhocoris]|uniref:Transmembrane protein n=1 Tax=Leptomonas pyrrhocoris TaxID=157538 RepID=A0A0M9GA97_LEPPY|nr:putative mitochondrial hypothetical protein [Leptomonas pyrrhocoris]KPA85969.1 putative mitochondrial hypothetical protein [Leptomonas pyrrhocoris]|eukprot:XP_015664408.1 putative mitochondrial hypothetical protein [Leptomonas pyrrhocoris]
MHKVGRVLAATAVPFGCVYHAGHHSMRRCTTFSVSSSFAGQRALSTLQQPPLQVRSFTGLLPLSHANSCTYATLRAATRTQHAHATSTAAEPETGAAASGASTAPTASESAPEAPKPAAAEQQPARKDGIQIDPSRLPSTIPGISQEELAARITAYHTKKAQEAKEWSSKALTQEVELMRRSLSPNNFEAYMQDLEKGMAAAAKEQAKLAAMSPVQLHQYQQKKKRQAVRYEWYKTFLMFFALVGSTAFLFSLFLFFE